eukprot:3566655-Rhodomonas_salina.1
MFSDQYARWKTTQICVRIPIAIPQMQVARPISVRGHGESSTARQKHITAQNNTVCSGHSGSRTRSTAANNTVCSGHSAQTLHTLYCTYLLTQPPTPHGGTNPGHRTPGTPCTGQALESI